MADDKLKLPRSSYEELCKIIKAYGRMSEPASLDQVNAIAGVGKTTISANNSFLASIGIIEGGAKKIGTDSGKRLAKALEHEIADEIEASWRVLVENNEFLRKMTLAIKIRKTMEESNFSAHIAYTAGEPKSKGSMTGARTVIDILKSSGFLVEEDGKLSSNETQRTETDKLANEEKTFGKEDAINETKKGSFAFNVSDNISINIDINVDADPSELEALGSKIKSMLRNLSSDSDSSEDSTKQS